MRFRVCCSPFETGSTGSPRVHTNVSPVLAQTFTAPFVVYSAKRFPGVPGESSSPRSVALRLSLEPHLPGPRRGASAVDHRWSHFLCARSRRRSRAEPPCLNSAGCSFTCHRRRHHRAIDRIRKSRPETASGKCGILTPPPLPGLAFLPLPPRPGVPADSSGALRSLTPRLASLAESPRLEQERSPEATRRLFRRRF